MACPLSARVALIRSSRVGAVQAQEGSKDQQPRPPSALRSR
jgi:hypothetical protein